MANRFLVWLSTGVLAVGVSIGALAGAGLALADDGTADGAGTSSSAESSKSEGTQKDSQSDDDTGPDTTDGDTDTDSVDDDAPDEVDDAPADDDEEEPAAPVLADEDLAEETAAPEEPADTEDTTDEHSLPLENSPESRAIINVRPTVEPTGDEVEAAGPETVTVVDDESAPPPSAPVQLEPVAADEPEPPTTTDTAPSTTGLMMAAVDVEEAAPARPTLLNVIGTLAWSVLDFVVKMVVGPPAVPPGSTVTAGRSTLEIDCGDGYTADADWYYPKEGQPDKLIYFQHGFLARAGIYNLTLTELAERNNAIVVAPSITSNYFACDGCSLTADPMHAAVARLFEGDRAALLASAQAAGFEGTLPTQFVFAGQSAGSMLAAGASGYYYASAPADRKSDMVGVLLFDGSAANGALARALDKLPSSVPVLHVAGVPTVINNGGDANQVLAEKRPGQFNGIQLVGGAHSDAFRSDAYFGLVQAFVSLTFGASTPENVEAVQVLSQGWLTDMYERRVYNPATRTGIYGTPGQPGATMIDIPTDAGLANAYVLPGPPHGFSLFDRVIMALLGSINANDFATCAAAPAESQRDACGA